ncbi:uncharacterized protein ACA1_247570 [Acanthamoeba castellanii str. Neff]|uniref:Uncharacterized protein n=1 Tax=Acanthamoeba castellanii (strain ATCC 30010 / Neff) TaxID=1257118 RepID=L8GKC8_ACACF|nr:uncharacterized protein ACA1_247570 [Acanthamoeba castellanii str. Neff]ELR13530.1 hypothetical protein ACA1_247570 [Acanthamoeba castellanii str. Neff]
MPVLEALFHDAAQPVHLRANALETLSFLAPVHIYHHRKNQDGDDEEEKGGDDEVAAAAKEAVQRTVDLLVSFLPSPSGLSEATLCNRRANR